MQTSVQRENAVRFGSWALNISTDNWNTWINLWALKDAKLVVDKIIKEMVFDNAKAKPKVKINEVVFSASLYEIALDNLQKIDWIADYITIDWTATNVTWEDLGTGWVVWTPIRLKNKNGDNTIVTNIVINADWTALVAWTDYDTYVHAGYTFVLPKTAQTGVLTGDYTYTPLARKEQIYKDVQKYLALNMFKFSNYDENGKEFSIVFPQGYNKSWIEAQFQPDDSEDTMGLWIEIKAFPDSSNELFRIIDEQDV